MCQDGSFVIAYEMKEVISSCLVLGCYFGMDMKELRNNRLLGACSVSRMTPESVSMCSDNIWKLVVSIYQRVNQS